MRFLELVHQHDSEGVTADLIDEGTAVAEIADAADDSRQRLGGLELAHVEPH